MERQLYMYFNFYVVLNGKFSQISYVEPFSIAQNSLHSHAFYWPVIQFSRMYIKSIIITVCMYKVINKRAFRRAGNRSIQDVNEHCH